jgi:hypothetical protein
MEFSFRRTPARLRETQANRAKTLAIEQHPVTNADYRRLARTANGSFLQK